MYRLHLVFVADYIAFITALTDWLSLLMSLVLLHLARGPYGISESELLGCLCQDCTVCLHFIGTKVV
jgi:hypothetical protein